MLAEGARYPSPWRVKVSPWRDGTLSVPQMAAWLLLPGGKKFIDGAKLRSGSKLKVKIFRCHCDMLVIKFVVV